MPRAGQRLSASWSTTSSADEAVNSTANQSDAKRNNDELKFRAVRAIDEFEAPRGPRMRVEALANGAGYEQSIYLNNLKVTIAETTSASVYAAVPERMVTVFKRGGPAAGQPSHSYEVVFSKSATLTGVSGHDAVQQARNDDTDRAETLTISSLLDETAQAYGTSPGQLIKAVVSVTPVELGSALSQVISAALPSQHTR